MTVEEKVIDRLIELGYHISFAESCTGGMCCSTLVGIGDASKVLDVSFTTYAPEAKSKFLGVSPDTIDNFGVVSTQVAEEMCRGVAKVAGSRVGVGITGVAGPTGGTERTPVGTVCFGFYIDGRVYTTTRHFGDLGRNNVRAQATEFVYITLDKLLNNA
ncbi:MAG: CinA family protein [Eubacterium sp.]